MSFFRSKGKINLQEEIDKISYQILIVESQKKEFPNVINNFVIFFSLLAIIADLLLPIGIATALCWIPVFVLLIFRSYRLKSYNRNLEELQKQKSSLQNQIFSENDYKRIIDFLESFNSKLNQTNEFVSIGEASPLCSIYDRIFHTYTFNPKALICPSCRANNGLSDKDDIEYYCPNCHKKVNKTSVAKSKKE